MFYKCVGDFVEQFNSLYWILMVPIPSASAGECLASVLALLTDDWRVLRSLLSLL